VQNTADECRRQSRAVLPREQSGVSVAEGLAAALGNAAGEKTDLGTGNTANWSRMARRVGDAQDGNLIRIDLCRAASVMIRLMNVRRG